MEILNNIFSEKYFEHRIVIGVIIILSLLACIFGVSLGLNKDDIFINLITEVLGVFFTLCVISSILQVRRERKVKLLNKNISEKIMGSIAYVGFNPLLELCEILSPAMGGSVFIHLMGKHRTYDEKEVVSAFRNLENRKKIIKLIEEKYSTYSKDNLYFVESIVNIYKNLTDVLFELLKDVKPYPNPKYRDKIFSLQLSRTAINFYEVFTKIKLRNSKGETIIPTKETITQLNFALGEHYKSDIKRILQKDFELLLEIFDKASTYEVSLDI